MTDQPWYCVRQRAGPLVKECRAIRPRLSKYDTPYERREKNMILYPNRDSSVCRSNVDRLELRLALFGNEGRIYTLTFADEPARFADCRKLWRAYLRKLQRKRGQGFDYISLRASTVITATISTLRRGTQTLTRRTSADYGLTVLWTMSR